MARELDLDLLQCSVHGRLAVAFGTRQEPDGTEGPWHPWCPTDLDLYSTRDNYLYVRFRGDPLDPARERRPGTVDHVLAALHRDGYAIVDKRTNPDPAS